MISRLIFASTALLLVGLAAPARAQLGSCTGGLMGDVGMVIQSGSSTTQIAPVSIGYAVSAADCACSTTDLAMQIKINGPGLPASPAGTVEAWVGNGCESYTVRTNPTQKQCAKVPTTLTFQDFTQFSSGGIYRYQPIPMRTLFDPIAGMCSSVGTANKAYVIITTSDPMNPTVCTLPLAPNISHPADFTASTSPGDGAITVNWTTPALGGGSMVQNFQVLCADENYAPLFDASSMFTQNYSVCTNADTDAGTGTMYRRDIAAASSTGPGSTDMGTGTAAAPGDFVGSAALFAQNDPHYRCSTPGTGNSLRVDGLMNGKSYFFRVVAADNYGNFSVADAGSGVPAAAEDYYRRYASSGGKASGFCFIATAAFGSYESRWVHVLRDFRDEWLLTSDAGRAFVDWYYAHSPPLAAAIAERPLLKAVVQALLWPVIFVAALLVYTTVWQKLLLVAAIIFLWQRRRNRRLPLRQREARA